MTNPVSLQDVQTFFKPRPLDAHKGLFGRILVIGGDLGMPGAVRLAGEGALRMGSGLVTVVTRKAHVTAVLSTCPELLCYGVGCSLRIFKRLLGQATVLVLGSGLGQSWWSQRLFRAALASDVPMVIDADGLNFLAHLSRLPPSKSWILTPHPGEAARMLGISVAEIQQDRLGALSKLTERYGGVIVLKGAGTLIGTAGQEPVQCVAGNPAMASAGMGDVLSGMIGGCLGLGLTPWEAAQAGVVSHASAADRIITRDGGYHLLASDILQDLARASCGTLPRVC